MLFTIGKVRALEGHSVVMDAPVVSYDALCAAFLVELLVAIDSDRPVSYRPRAFGLLYDLLGVNAAIARSEPFAFSTNDGLDVRGECDDNGIEYFLQLEMGAEVVEHKVATGELLVVICSLVADLVRGLDHAGICALDYVRRVRPALWSEA